MLYLLVNMCSCELNFVYVFPVEACQALSHIPYPWIPEKKKKLFCTFLVYQVISKFKLHR